MEHHGAGPGFPPQGALLPSIQRRRGCSLRAKLPAFGACGRRQQKQRYLTAHLPEVDAEVMPLGLESEPGKLGGFMGKP